MIERIQDILFWLLAIPLVLGMCALFWLCRAADVRPVVTCADCKYNKREVTDLCGNDAIQCITGLTHRRDWFCADGKKREES